jgi:dolichyl-diphosphooligosaccharide--protein glycosyltransferase
MSSKSNSAASGSDKVAAKAAVASNTTGIQDSLMQWAWIGAYSYAAFVVLRAAYTIRLGAIESYGIVIHEFDPQFNYRCAEVSCSVFVVQFVALDGDVDDPS